MNHVVDEYYLPLDLKKKYELSRLLGKGACGEVRLAYDKVSRLFILIVSIHYYANTTTLFPFVTLLTQHINVTNYINRKVFFTRYSTRFNLNLNNITS